MEKSFQTLCTTPAATARDDPSDLFDRYCGRRWGYGHRANKAAAAVFAASARTIANWRNGYTALPARVMMRIMVLEGLDGLLDRIDPDSGG